MVLALLALVVTVLLTVPFTVLAGAHPHVDVARDFSAAQLAREIAFHGSVRPPAYLSLLVAVVVAAALGLTGLGARLVGAIPGHWTVKAALGAALVLALGQLVRLPFDVQAERVLRRDGLSTQDWTGWTDDLLRGFALKAGTTALAVLILLALARTLPQRWWAAPVRWPPHCWSWAGRSCTPWWSSRPSTASRRCRPGSCVPICWPWPLGTTCP